MKATLFLTYLPAILAVKPPAFILAGDSTTAAQSVDGGGWGNGFLSFLDNAAWGVNKGHNGATTKSYVDGGDWAAVKGLVSNYVAEYDTFVTIQFGHNDQKSTSGVTLAQYQANLQNFVVDIASLGGRPVSAALGRRKEWQLGCYINPRQLLITPLTRRSFDSEHSVSDSLHDQRLVTIAVAEATGATYLDLNQASINYVDAIGEEAAQVYNLNPEDETHLNDWGSVVFGRMVADLMLEKQGDLTAWIRPNETLSNLIKNGQPA
ncbi:SGNH hydrolase-type esterase domain-containing protein [Xylaria nigripes]|nr:SGNH hydrolase-type esterase domain-containing protein [Xylaria nigripes]